MSGETTIQSTWALLALVILTVLSLALPDDACAANGRNDHSALYEHALTFAQVEDGQKATTILVTYIESDTARGINLSDINQRHPKTFSM